MYRLCGLTSPFARRLAARPAHIRDQQRQRGRRDAINAARLADRARTMELQLLPNFVRKSRHHSVVDVLAEDEAFIAAIRLDIGPQ